MLLALSRSLARLVLAVLALSLFTWAGDKQIRLTLPKRTKPTPVQQLNREGVKAVEKHDYDKARKLFYRAYLLDPNDPFTLNNLGYISELQGDIDRAQRFYDLAQQQTSDATVALASSGGVEGRPVSKVAGNAAERGMEVNRLNVSASGLLLKERAPEADLVLQKALAIDPKNPFTLNNMGFAKEKQGEYEAALGYYTAAASMQSNQPIVVTVNKNWRGKPISSVAAENAKKLRKLMAKSETTSARVARLNLQGVSAMNRNDRQAARQYFQQAYRLDPENAFTLNNMGFLAELDGDRETADFYYERAQDARQSGAKVTVATRRDAEGKRVEEVAAETDAAVEAKMRQMQEQRQREGGPIELKRRDGTPVTQQPRTPPQ